MYFKKETYKLNYNAQNTYLNPKDYLFLSSTMAFVAGWTCSS